VDEAGAAERLSQPGTAPGVTRCVTGRWCARRGAAASRPGRAAEGRCATRAAARGGEAMTTVHPRQQLAGEEMDLMALLRPRVAAVLEPVDADETGWAGAVQRAVAQVLDSYAHEALTAGRAPLPEATEARVRRMLVHSFVGAGGLQALLDDDEIETIN